MMFVLAKQLASVKWLFDSRSDLGTTTLVRLVRITDARHKITFYTIIIPIF